MSGTLSFEVAAPYVKRGIEEFTITLTEVGNEANTVSATAKSTALGVSLRPSSAKPSDKVRFEGLGFTNDAPIYAHYLHKGRLRRTVRMAREPRQCGGFRVHRRQIPIRRPGLGDWIVRFDQSKQLTRPPDGNYVRLRLVLRLLPARSNVSSHLPRASRSSPLRSAASTTITSPAAKSPCSSPSARRSTRCFWITRLSGRAPYVGS